MLQETNADSAISRVESDRRRRRRRTARGRAETLFGCDGFFVGGTIFSMIWKEGRIGLKLRDEGDYDALMKMKGAGPWCPSGKMTMSGWVLVAPVLHDADKLAPWVAKAHAQAVGAPKKPAKKKMLATAKKTAKSPAKKRRV